MSYQAVFFDFDGVILDSVHVKTEAFAAMFRKYGPKVEQSVVDYHLANGGVSRFRKFEYYYTHLLKKPIDKKTLNHLGDEFNKLSLQGVLDAQFITGALETLKELLQKRIPCFVASGTPDEEIKLIVEKRKLTPYFEEVHGSPTTKDEILLDIACRYNYRLHDCLFIGDAMTDFEAARMTGTDFLGILKDKGLNPFPAGVRVQESVRINLETTKS